jgi:hypothetical protein
VWRALRFKSTALLGVWFLFLSSCPLRAQNLTKADWLADIDYTVDQVIKTHPFPFRRISKEEFESNATSLKRDLPKLGDDEIVVRLMQIVASLRDGHTSLDPSPEVEAPWFPIRFYQFNDGLFVTAIDKQFANCAGAKVLRVGEVSADEAVKRAQSAFSADNNFGAQEAAVSLSSPRIIRGLSIADNVDRLKLQLLTRKNENLTIELPTVKAKSNLEYRLFGEMFGPVSNLVTAFNDLTNDFLNPDNNPNLPLHLRGRRAYWFTYLPKERLLYFELNAMREKSGNTKETLSEMLRRMFTFCDLHSIDVFVLDLRYNSGGNGQLVNGIVHEFIKRDSTINREGHLFTIVGRKTYSAGATMAMTMKEHTHTAFIGEPMGVGPNGSGDPDATVLPNSHLHLSISTNYYIGGKSKDQSWEVPVQFPAQFSSAQYFSGQDPALDVALNESGHAELLEVLRTDGSAAAMKLYEVRRQRYGSLSWWQPFEREKLNAAGYQLLNQGRKEDAITAFLIVADRYPEMWEPWDSLAEGYMGAGKYKEAIAAYQKALQISPNNFNASFAKKSIEKMEEELKKQSPEK